MQNTELEPPDYLQYDSCSLTGMTEVLCETIIESLRQLRSAAIGPVTPSLLSQSLIQNGTYVDTLSAAFRWREALTDSAYIEPYLDRLQQFQFDLLRLCENAFAESGSCARELCLLVKGRAHIEEVLSLNSRILDFIREAGGRSIARQQEFIDLLTDVSKKLVEVEQFITVSLSNSKKKYIDDRAVSEALEKNVIAISRAVAESRSLDELKSFIHVKLDAIKNASRRKLEMEGEQLLKSEREINELKLRIKMMRRQVLKARRQADAMERASSLDPLTGVANRRGFQKYIREEWKRYDHSKIPFSILMIDIDNFKSINDRFGHWAGDKCLSELAKRIKSNLRATDFLARYGGEEFIVVLPATQKEGAVTVAEILRSHIEQTRFLYRGERIPLTISIGISTVREDDRSLNSILDRVDKGLYEAKDNGRNHVSIV